MSLPWVLFAAQQGVSLLGASSRSRSARQQAAAMAGQAMVEGALERYQIRREAEQTARDLQWGLADSLASQNAALGAVGVSGGRTASMLQAQSQLNAQEAGSRLRLGTLSALQASQYREDQTVRAARSARSAASSQLGLDLFGQLVSAGDKAIDLLGRKKE